MKCDAEYYNCIRMLVSLLGNHASTRINFELLTSSVHDVKSLDSMQGSISREQLMVWKKQAPQERPACVPLSAVSRLHYGYTCLFFMKLHDLRIKSCNYRYYKTKIAK
jgi:hypothetical protein